MKIQFLASLEKLGKVVTPRQPVCAGLCQAGSAAPLGRLCPCQLATVPTTPPARCPWATHSTLQPGRSR